MSHSKRSFKLYRLFVSLLHVCCPVACLFFNCKCAVLLIVRCLISRMLLRNRTYALQADVLHNLRAKIRDLRAQMERLGIYTVRALTTGSQGEGGRRGVAGDEHWLPHVDRRMLAPQ